MKQARKVCKDWDNLPMLMDVDTTALALNVSYSTAIRLCRAGTIPAIQFGRTWRVHRDALRKYVEGVMYK